MIYQERIFHIKTKGFSERVDVSYSDLSIKMANWFWIVAGVS